MGLNGEASNLFLQVEIERKLGKFRRRKNIITIIVITNLVLITIPDCSVHQSYRVEQE